MRHDDCIDHTARRKLAEAVRRFGAGQTTNKDFEASIPASGEWALHEIEFFGVWPFYDDLRAHKLTGPWTPTPAGKKLLARVVLFLKSDQPYRYPRRTGKWLSFLTLFVGLTGGLSLAGVSFLLSTATALLLMAVIVYTCLQITLKRYVGRQQEFWPFFCKADYLAALSKPMYLSGRKHGS